jgi:hypothetical protein
MYTDPLTNRADGWVLNPDNTKSLKKKMIVQVVAFPSAQGLSHPKTAFDFPALVVESTFRHFLNLAKMPPFPGFPS